eukprot:4043925-Prymnesium_polylepis.1
MVYRRDFGYVNLLIQDWITELITRRSTANDEYIRDRTSRGLDHWGQPDKQYPQKLISWLQRTSEGQTIISDLQLREEYNSARDKSVKGGELQQQIFEKALPQLEARVERARVERAAAS